MKFLFHLTRFFQSYEEKDNFPFIRGNSRAILAILVFLLIPSTRPTLQNVCRFILHEWADYWFTDQIYKESDFENLSAVLTPYSKALKTLMNHWKQEPSVIEIPRSNQYEERAIIVMQELYEVCKDKDKLQLRAICPDFYKGQAPWTPSSDWATFDDWLKTRDSKHINKEADVVLKYLKEQCNAKKIGVIGFCWGGAAVHHLMLKYSEFKAGVSLYGVIKFTEDNCQMKNPTFYIFGEKDDIIPLDQVTALEQKLKQQCKTEFEVKIYPGQTHGFVHRKREDINPQDKPYIEEARKDMLNWLNRYI